MQRATTAQQLQQESGEAEHCQATVPDLGAVVPDFSRIGALSDAWLPELRMWVGDYPYLLRPALEELCRLRLSRGGRN